VDLCVHLALAHADLVVLVAVVLAVRALVAQVADQVVLVVRVLVVLVVVSVVLVVVVLVADLVVLVAVVLVAVVLAVAVTDNAVHQRRSRVLVVVKTSMKCCHRQPRRIRRATHQFLKVLSLSNVVPRRKSLHQS
jgi:ABC-type iron transport system FetAB permease component